MNITQLPVTELQRWQQQGQAFHLLDVRTDEETAVCALPNALHIPMNLIPLRHNELPDDGLPIVVYCHHGIRSLHTAMYLADAGFDNLYNLQGGIDEWAKQIAPDMPRY
ncbi:rhodanese-like domain-containing protein [Neisseria lisongii]|uniref:Sulfurtransferase n=1 Tax=Neisseria lisongii TaxID=2912188 RepID=A0AAW5AK82_9NEIS|nr:rhodanese-like domain-containing protein [Neisseria lisongii]MCF7530502.1 sulfurtransferase [Neisseria lisongii]